MLKEVALGVGIGLGVIAGGYILSRVIKRLSSGDHIEKAEYEILTKEDLIAWFNDYKKTSQKPFKGLLTKKSDLENEDDSEAFKKIMNEGKNFLTQSILDKGDNVIKTRIVYYSVLDEPLRQMFYDCKGPIIIEFPS